jgi:hypothetical protein
MALAVVEIKVVFLHLKEPLAVMAVEIIPAAAVAAAELAVQLVVMVPETKEEVPVVLERQIA